MAIADNLKLLVRPSASDTAITNLVGGGTFTGTGTPTLVDEGSDKGWLITSGTLLEAVLTNKTLNPNLNGSGVTIAVRFKRTVSGSDSYMNTVGIKNSAGNVGSAIRITRYDGNVWRGRIQNDLQALTTTPNPNNEIVTLVYRVITLSASSGAPNQDNGSIWQGRSGRVGSDPDAIGYGNYASILELNRAFINCQTGAEYVLLDFAYFDTEKSNEDCAAIADNYRGVMPETGGPVAPVPIAFSGSIPAQTGSVNTPYNLNLSPYFTGNKTPFTYALASGSLPAGLSLSGSTITGTPTTTSTGLTFSIRGTDADGATATSNVVGITINAAPIPVSFSGTIPQLSGIVNSSLSRNIASYFTGSETPFTYAIASGSLPAGVTLSGSTITGTPTVSGTFNVSIRATDTKSNVATSNSFAIVISASPIAIGFSGSIPAQTGTLNTPFSLNLSSYFTGNLTPFTFSVVSGSLPAGLSINGDVISGTPTNAGTGSFTIRGTDTANNIATSNSVSFTINTAPIPVAFTGTINPINAAVNIPVNVDVSSNFTGNIKPFTYAIASGGLPSGLSLNGSVITGTPTSVATTSLTIRATDNQGNTAVSNSISVNIAASVTPVTFTGTIGSLSGTKGLPLNSTNITGYFWGSLTPFVYNIQSGVLPSGVVLNNGVLQGTPTITGTFPITVRATDTGSNVATSNEFSIVISEPAAGTTIISRSNMTPTTVTISANYSGTDNSGFEYSLSDGPWVAVPVSPFTVEGLTEFTSYTLVVRPKVASNDGLVSNTLTFKTYRGVLASQVPSTGVSGPSCIYNDITKHNTLQNDYVYCNYLTEPSGGGGVFTPKPDGSFSWVGAADGVYTFTYQYEVNNVEIGPVKNVKLIIG